MVDLVINSIQHFQKKEKKKKKKNNNIAIFDLNGNNFSDLRWHFFLSFPFHFFFKHYSTIVSFTILTDMITWSFHMQILEGKGIIMEKTHTCSIMMSSTS